VAANPSKIKPIAPRLRESTATTNTIANTIDSMIGRPIGSPFAASGAAKKQGRAGESTTG